MTRAGILEFVVIQSDGNVSLSESHFQNGVFSGPEFLRFFSVSPYAIQWRPAERSMMTYPYDVVSVYVLFINSERYIKIRFASFCATLLIEAVFIFMFLRCSHRLCSNILSGIILLALPETADARLMRAGGGVSFVRAKLPGVVLIERCT